MFSFHRTVRALGCAIVFSIALPQLAAAHSYEIGTLKIGHPWSRATPDGAKVGAGYLKITNTGSQSDRLVGGTFEQAERFEIHEMKMNDGKMTMRQLPDGLTIPAGETVALEPGAMHLMFQGLSQRLVEGENIKGTLRFEKAGEVAVEFAVSAIGAKEKPQSDNSHHHHH